MELHHPMTIGGTEYLVKADVDYTKNCVHSFSDLGDRIGWADAGYCFDLRFRTDSDDIHAIEISATIEWLRWEEGSPLPGDEYWTPGGQTTVSTVVSIANYWQ